MAQPLFAGRPLQASLSTISNKLLDAATNLPADAWLPDAPGGGATAAAGLPPSDDVASTADVVGKLLATVSLILPVIDWNAQTVTVTETPVTIMDFVPRYKAQLSQRVPGFQVVATVPYVGSRILMIATPTAHIVGGLDTGVRVAPGVRSGTIEVKMTGRHIDPEVFSAHLARVRLLIDGCLATIADDVSAWRHHLSASLGYEVEQRRRFQNDYARISKAIFTWPDVRPQRLE